MKIMIMIRIKTQIGVVVTKMMIFTTLMIMNKIIKSFSTSNKILIKLNFLILYTIATTIFERLLYVI